VPTPIYAKNDNQPKLYFRTDVPIELPEPAKAAIAKAEAEQKALAKQKALLVKKASTKAALPYNPCSCVSYAKWLSGINVGSVGAAKNHPINSTMPVVGGLIVFKAGIGMSQLGHLAVVIAVDGNLITTKGGNEQSCVAGTIRHYDMGVDYIRIKGFYNPI
jgi:hypothetical protein